MAARANSALLRDGTSNRVAAEGSYRRRRKRRAWVCNARELVRYSVHVRSLVTSAASVVRALDFFGKGSRYLRIDAALLGDANFLDVVTLFVQR